MRQKLTTTKRHIHLNLKTKWFDMILAGIKREEYRDLSNYWQKRLFKIYDFEFKNETIHPIVDSIIFSNGYAKDRRQFEIEFKGAMINVGREEWGAEVGKEYHVIQLGNVIQSNCT